MRQDYEDKVMKHYTRVAQESGLSASCTMEDEYIREGETRAILRLIELAAKGAASSLRVLDVGCGTGLILARVAGFAAKARYSASATRRWPSWLGWSSHSASCNVSSS